MTITNIMKKLEDAKLIDVILQSSGRRPTIYVLKELINITENINT